MTPSDRHALIYIAVVIGITLPIVLHDIFKGRS